jgi:hypothetical protein
LLQEGLVDPAIDPGRIRVLCTTEERTLALQLSKAMGEKDFVIPLYVDGLRGDELDWMTSDLGHPASARFARDPGQSSRARWLLRRRIEGLARSFRRSPQDFLRRVAAQAREALAAHPGAFAQAARKTEL